MRLSGGHKHLPGWKIHYERHELPIETNALNDDNVQSIANPDFEMHIL